MADGPFDRPLLAAELHYFRVPRARWPLALARVRQLGASVVSTCVPWSWHVPTPDACDLTGATDAQRDVVGFVELCARLGLGVILRPGPFVDAGLLGGGIPPWLLRRHPALHALRPNGQPWLHGGSDLPRASYGHPLFRAHARGWIEQFSARLAPLQAPAGPVLAVQVDSAMPRDGALPAAIERDPRFRCDYNPHVRQSLWPQWLEARYETTAALNDAWGARYDAFETVPLPEAWEAPAGVEALRRYVDLNAFADHYYADALATTAGWLRDGGWATPLFHNLPAAPWGDGGVLADMAGYADACGWLAHNVYSQEAGRPFEEYVHFAHWRTRLLRTLSPARPAFAAEISAAQDFFFAAPFAGGLDGASVYAAQQSAREPRALAAYAEWAMEAPLREEGAARPRLWNARVPFALLDACGGWATSRPPADLALGYSHAPEHVALWLRLAAPGALAGLEALTEGADQAVLSQRLAQRLVRAGVDFDVVDLDTATPEQLARYRLVVAPAPPLLPRATQRALAQLDNLVLVGEAQLAYDERLRPCDLLAPEAVARLPEAVDGATLGALVEELGGVARYAWADAEGVDVLVRHGALPGEAYLVAANRREAAYSGTVAYRDAAGGIEHIQLALGPRRVAMLALRDGEVLGAAIGGDASEGGWRVRGLRGGVSWSGGAGVVAPYAADGAAGDAPPAALLLSAPQSGRFDLRRREGWQGLAVYRLLLDGRLGEALSAVESTHLVVPYVSEDELGPTDSYLVAAPNAPLPARLHGYLATLLRAKARLLENAAALAPAEGAANLRSAAALLDACAAAPASPNAYRMALQEALGLIMPVAQAAVTQITALRAARAAGRPADEGQETALEAELHALILARMGD